MLSSSLPLFGKEGLGEILDYLIPFQIPPYPPFLKGGGQGVYAFRRALNPLTSKMSHFHL